MGTALIIGTTALLQFIGAFFALKLVQVTGRRPSWMLLAAGLCLLGMWHSFVLWDLLAGRSISHFGFAEELVELSYSALVLAGVLWISPLFRTIKRSQEDLKESEQNLHQLTSQLMAVQEVERKRLSHELHDDLGQSLLALKLHLRILGQRLGLENRTRDAEYEDLLLVLNELIDIVQHMHEDLSPLILENLGLPAAIRQLARETLEHYQIRESSVDVDEVEDIFSPEAGIILYRIVQEALTNIGKHAGAGRVCLAIKRQGDAVSCLIEDNGQGFKVEEVLGAGPSRGKGLGLAAMKERVRMLAGKLDLRSRVGEGTKVSFTVPIPARVEPTAAGA
ncbi:MAG TPA: sensor histidine kinase [Desulfobaccales bacterium]